jgi:hypothetical protein
MKLTPEAAAPRPLEWATLADRRSRIRGVRLAKTALPTQRAEASID